ncbi:MAG TPA: single-stranded-DNA-specific exonuclease RecJ [Terriglobales bacterium]|nr:single-stranded-DNA-specific exonuclease RecJ [Terriglobales bacterium]
MRWTLKAADESLVSRLLSEARLDPLVARLLTVRGVRDPEEAARFLHPSLDHLHSPYLMLGMKTAIERLRAAIERKEKVLIYGDYDVDGTTAIVILKTAIELCGGAADFHVPHRIREGYGMKDEVIERAAAEGVRLIISVDTGIRAFAAAKTARRVGVDLIVTDHHLPEVEQGVPGALAVLNPNQPGCSYPCKELCGAGVAFKIVQALLEESGRARLLPSFLKMVAIATVADAVDLVGENRVIARLGLDGLRHAVNPGLRALIAVSALDSGQAINSGDVAFRLAPRINAAGRMDVAQDVVELFSTRDGARAHELAEHLDRLNAERQGEEQRIMAEIHERLDSDAALRDRYCMVIDGEGWHRGVVGICATRVVERTGRPALVVACEGEEAHGSGRSIEAFHLLNALESCAGLFTRFGGHAHAAGFALPSDRLPELCEALDRYARARLTPGDFEHPLNLDAELRLEQITSEFYAQIEQLRPFGVGNPEPLFVARGVRIGLPPKVLKEKHLKLRVVQESAVNNGRHAFDAMGWRMVERTEKEPLVAGDVLDIAFIVERNSNPEFAGMRLSLRDYAGVAKAAGLGA